MSNSKTMKKHRNISAKEARKVIEAAIHRHDNSNSYHFPAIQQDVKLDKGRVPVDLGFQKDFFSFLQELDKEMIGNSRIDLSDRDREEVVGGFNTVYPFYSANGNRKLAHVWFYSGNGSDALNWHIRGHEEGHVINSAVEDLSPLEQKVNRDLTRFNSETLPMVLSDVAIKTRGHSNEDLRDAHNKSGYLIDEGDYFKPIYGIIPEDDVEKMVTRSAVFHLGANECRKRDGRPIGEHIKEILDHIDEQKYDPKTRSKLRRVALVHDIAKYITNNSDVSGRLHGEIAADISNDFYFPEDLRRIIKAHDYHFYLYTQFRGSKKKVESGANSPYARALRKVDMPLMIKFNYADSTNRDLTPVKWFERNMDKLGL